MSRGSHVRGSDVPKDAPRDCTRCGLLTPHGGLSSLCSDCRGALGDVKAALWDGRGGDGVDWGAVARAVVEGESR